VFPRSGPPCGSARLRREPEDFQVREELRDDPPGQGPHAYLYVRKRDLTTEGARRRIAEAAGVSPRDVGFAGRKDRRAVTWQWFSVPGADTVDWEALGSEALRVERLSRGPRKLRRGALRGNRFHITLRDFRGDPGALEERLQAIGTRGIPNYFGEQRFGRGRGNLASAAAWLARRPGRHGPKDMLLSAARAWLFNHVLAARVVAGNWQTVLDGDALNLDGSRSFFAVERADDQLANRCRELDVHPTGPLWGRGTPPVGGPAHALEARVLAAFAGWRTGLEGRGVDMGRRALRARVAELGWQVSAAGVELEFFLAGGSFATSVVREIVSEIGADAPGAY